MPNPVAHSLAVTASVLASTAAGWRGAMQRRARSVATDPNSTPLPQLFDMEGCPYCRVVREALSELQLDVEVYPCPKGGTRFRPRAAELVGRKTTFPVFYDVERGQAMPESADIVEYLWEHYDSGRAVRPNALTYATSSLATAMRPTRGFRARPSRGPAQLLELYSFEASPYSRLVRERLTELELPYRLWQLAKEQRSDIGPANARLTLGKWTPVPGGRREAMIARTGRAQVPCLVDPNTGRTLFESADIIDYLESTYAL